MRDVAVRVVFGVGLGVKGVARRMNTYKAHPAMNGVQEFLFPRLGHWRILVGSSAGEIAGREEYDRVLREQFGIVMKNDIDL